MNRKYTPIAERKDNHTSSNHETFLSVIPLKIDEELHKLVLSCIRSGIAYERVHHSENKIYMINRLNYLLHELILSYATFTKIYTTSFPIESTTCEISADDIRTYIALEDEDIYLDTDAEYIRYTELLAEATEHILKW